jgi:hypothetical protein
MLAIVGAAGLSAQPEYPAATPDGLERVASERVDVVYWRPGASLATYRRVALLDCSVAFRENWEQEQRQRRSVYFATPEDMQRIGGLLAEEFRMVFTRELTAGGYEVVSDAAEDVLLLRPAIVDLDVAAPDLGVPGIVMNYVTNAGEMTLQLDLVDPVTGSVLGRAIDREQGSEARDGFLISDAAKNREEADRILQRWALTLRGALDDRWSGR